MPAASPCRSSCATAARISPSCRALPAPIVGNAQSQSALQHVSTTFRATAPQVRIDVDRAKAETVHVSVDQVFDTLATYFGSTYVQQFNKFGRVFQVYVQADCGVPAARARYR